MLPERREPIKQRKLRPSEPRRLTSSVDRNKVRPSATRTNTLGLARDGGGEPASRAEITLMRDDFADKQIKQTR
jgi:hypothetical protein